MMKMSFKVLYLGDPHVQVSNIEESESLMQFVLSNATLESVDQLTILGDLFHTHSILRTQVLDFWSKWMKILSNQNFKTVILVGNHDAISNSDMSIHSLKVFKEMELKNIEIIDSPTVKGSIGYLPYIHKSEDFIKAANSMSASVLVCHGEFSGSQYENGYFAPHGVNPDQLNASLIISGHIHKKQQFGKVIHPGTARWLTNSEANQEKGIWIAEHDLTSGSVISSKYLDTSSVCTPIISKQWIEGEEMPSIPEKARVTIELIGSQTWVNKQKTLLKGKVAVSSKVTDRDFVKNRQSGSSLLDFISNVFDTNVDKSKILSYLKEKDLV